MACIEPPHPPPEAHLVRHYTGGTTTQFGDVTKYTCEDGYYFGSDMLRDNYNLTCYMNGSWEFPGAWVERCYHPTERFCFDPPSPAFNGGKYDWNAVHFNGSRTPYSTDVKYTCDLGRKLLRYTQNGSYTYDNMTLHCEWNRTWTPERPVWPDIPFITIRI